MNPNKLYPILFVYLFSLLDIAIPCKVQGQIVPDRTLPNNSVVNTEGKVHEITSGTTAGNNLFHSFSEFSVPTGGVAHFENPVNIKNIFSRVTGNSISVIDGLLQANGNANLFFINPQGIVFGENARLDVGGSFLATTANSIEFSDNSVFSATTPHRTPILTVSVPIGLQFGANPGAIIHQSGASPMPNSPPGGLEVDSGNTLALIGGDLMVDGGKISAPFGQIQLASVQSPDRVILTHSDSGMDFGYQNIQNFGNIDLSRGATIDASGAGGGQIQLRGDHISLRQASQVISDTLANENGKGIDIQANHVQIQEGAFISANTLGLGAGSDIWIDAAQSIELVGTGFETFEQTFVASLFNGERSLNDRATGIFTGTGSPGNGGELRINTSNLILRRGGVIAADTFGLGTGGNLKIEVLEGIEVNGSGLLVTTGDAGDTGNIDIATRHLRVTEGATIATITINSGKAGNVIIDSQNFVDLEKKPFESLVPTGIFLGSIGGTGSSGNIIINTTELTIQEGALVANVSGARTLAGIIPIGGNGGNIAINASKLVEISGISPDLNYVSGVSAASYSAAPSGNITVVTRGLIIRDGGFIGASSEGSGQGGRVTIHASEFVELIGNSIEEQGISGLFSSSGDAFFPVDATGSAGELQVFTPHLIIRDGSQVAVNSLGSGDAGNLEIFANLVEVLNGSSITAATVAGQGGNIQIQAQNIQLQRDSSITTNAGNNDGGNITIDTETLTALFNSDITANAREGVGGRVSINATGIFGTEFREAESPRSSDITATSELGAEFSGVVEINTPEIQATAGLVELPNNLVDVASLMGQDPCHQEQNSEFIVTGRGGLPPTPFNKLTGVRPLVDLGVSLSGSSENQITPRSISITSPPLTEATGWKRNVDGTVILTAEGGNRFNGFLEILACNK